ncbi:hypothetical protein LOC71_06040 [Rhodopirellula sp. JC740]|uniref:BON domain-containing protein n=1 Tax=Rhodopirellula halodulae TaxID=2894198 RepID=A0ABS8NE54_9BACT|nr:MULTISPECIES: hypothetical protein [unclassified Rhodopirellula]MCC9641828.1 hypothetical protein [Rhodopirellula sp. JC740]MCC9654819.1 hypothetical protein [Rhodopirellula sp. JC737]
MIRLMEATQPECHVQMTLQRIENMFREHATLSDYADQLHVSIADSSVLLEGSLPTADLRSELVPSIRQAGVLWRIDNQVTIGSNRISSPR